MMSGKTQPGPLIATSPFYAESPPKKSRLQDNNNIRPPFKVFKDKLANFDKKLSEPITTQGPSVPETITIAPTSSLSDSNVETKSLDRDSPIPLKNLGNTCYENSIIQCLFSLVMFMDNFERSMAKMREFVVPSKKNVETVDIITSSEDKIEKEPQTEEEGSPESIVISEEDVRFRIANAFDNLYKSYTQKRNQNVAHKSDDSDQKEVTILECNKQPDQSKTPEEQQLQHDQGQNNEAELPRPLLSTDNTSSMTPIALISSATSTNEQQSEIETRLEELKSAVGERSSQFNSTHQQDASEFFYHVIDSIQEFYQGLKKNDDKDNPVTKAFELELDYLIKCPKCHHKIISDPEKIRTLPLALPQVHDENLTTNQPDDDINRIPTPPTSDLGLDSPESSVSEEPRDGSEEKENQALTEDHTPSSQLSPSNTMSISKLELSDKTTPPKQNYTLCDALNNYFKDDSLEYKCSQPDCDSKQRTKKCLIRKLPQVLFITLARYSYTGKKNLDEITAPFELTIPFQENKSPSHSNNQTTQLEDDDIRYQLVAVVCHLGSSLNAGHYTSYVYNQNNFSWYSCDDDSITKVQESDVNTDASKSGYCFFYAHKSCVAQKPESNQQVVMEEDQLKGNESIVKESFILDSSTILTPESSPSPTGISQEDSGCGSDVIILNGPNGTEDWS